MFKLVLNTDGAAFEAPAMEIARILRQVAARLESADSHYAAGEHGAVIPVRDVNGNTCGAYAFALPTHEWESWGDGAAALVADFSEVFAPFEDDINTAILQTL